MHNESKWKNWPVLLLGIGLVVVLVVLANRLSRHKIFSTYLADVAGAMTAVVLSIATYDEWERRQQRHRFRPPEAQGLRRIKNEIAQLVFQYEFILSDRFSADKKASTKHNNAKRRISTAKQLAEAEVEKTGQPLNDSTRQLKQSKVHKLTYQVAEELLKQIEVTVSRIDAAISIYGYSFTPEIHKQSLQVREDLEQTLTGKQELLSIGLNSELAKGTQKLSASEQEAMRQVIYNLIRIAETTDKLEVR